MGIDPMNNISNNNKNTLCSYIISTLGTLNDGHMGLVGADLVIMTHRWAGNPTGWTEYPKEFFTKIRDVATTDSQRHGKDEMQLRRAWMQHLDLGR
jgi:hypothetical protein